MSASKWTVEGQLNETPEINSTRGRTHAIIRLDVGIGEIVVFAHDDLVLGDIRKLKTGDKVRFTGTIEARHPRLRSNKPYFLNPTFLEKLD
jgi:hypothetical protein